MKVDHFKPSGDWTSVGPICATSVTGVIIENLVIVQDNYWRDVGEPPSHWEWVGYLEAAICSK